MSRSRNWWVPKRIARDNSLRLYIIITTLFVLLVADSYMPEQVPLRRHPVIWSPPPITTSQNNLACEVCLDVEHHGSMICVSRVGRPAGANQRVSVLSVDGGLPGRHASLRLGAGLDHDLSHPWPRIFACAALFCQQPHHRFVCTSAATTP